MNDARRSSVTAPWLVPCGAGRIPGRDDPGRRAPCPRPGAVLSRRRSGQPAPNRRFNHEPRGPSDWPPIRPRLAKAKSWANWSGPQLSLGALPQGPPGRWTGSWKTVREKTARRSARAKPDSSLGRCEERGPRYQGLRPRAAFSPNCMWCNEDEFGRYGAGVDGTESRRNDVSYSDR